MEISISENTIKFYLVPIYIVKQVTWKGETENSEHGFGHCKIDMNLFAFFLIPS